MRRRWWSLSPVHTEYGAICRRILHDTDYSEIKAIARNARASSVGRCSVTAAAVSAIRLTPVAARQHPAVTHQSSAELAALEQVATTLNDRTVPVFDGYKAVPFPGIREWKMTGILGARETGAQECKP